MLNRELFKQITRNLVHPDDVDDYYLKLKNFSLLSECQLSPEFNEVLSQIRWLEETLNCGVPHQETEKPVFSEKSKERRSPESIISEIDDLIQKEKESSELTAILNFLAGNYGWTSRDLTSFYEQRKAFLEDEDFKEDVANEVRMLAAIARTDINLSDYLPAELAKPLNAFAKNLNTKRSIVLLTLLTACSACVQVGTKILCDRRKNWRQPAGLYSLMISPSGQGKSPIHDQLLQIPFWVIQSQWKQDWDLAMEDYERELLEIKSADKEERAAMMRSLEKPPEQQRVLFASDPTVIGLVNQFRVWPKQGILGLYDEARKLFSFDRTPSSGSDRSDFLTFYNGSGVLELRKDGVRNAVAELSYSVLGTIQPDILFDLMSDPNDADGQWARFQFCIQPLQRKTPASEEMSINLEELMVWLYKFLLSFEKATYPLSPDAQKAFDDYVYGEIEDKRLSSTVPALQSLYGKAGGTVGRVALNLHLINRCFDVSGYHAEISEQTIQAAISFNRFTIQQTQLLYSQSQINNDELPPKLAMIYQLAKQTGGVTARDIQRYRRAFRKEDNATIRQWLRKLADMDLGSLSGTGNRLKFHAL